MLDKGIDADNNMTFISTEEAHEIIWECFEYVYGEMCLDEQWAIRLNALIEEKQLVPLEVYNGTMDTFHTVVDNYNGDVDEVLIQLLVKEIKRRNSRILEAWVYKTRPDLDTREDGMLCWDMWASLDSLLEEENFLEMLKEKLGLTICLK